MDDLHDFYQFYYLVVGTVDVLSHTAVLSLVAKIILFEQSFRNLYLLILFSKLIQKFKFYIGCTSNNSKVTVSEYSLHM